MLIRTASYTDTGKRENNEDALRLQPLKDGVLAIVADGLGGLEAGEVASAAAATYLLHALAPAALDEDTLFDAVQAASAEVYRQSGGSTMRTTAAVLWLQGNQALAATVGDTRIYCFRDGEILFQSMDHSVAQMAVLIGELEPEGIRTSRDRNRLIRVLGDEEPPKPDLQTIPLQPGDRFLLCSDGLWEPVLERAMLTALQEADSPEDWISILHRLVVESHDPHQDNNTAIAVWVD